MNNKNSEFVGRLLGKKVRSHMSGRILWTCVAVMSCLSVDVYAIDLMGPPTATLEPLQFSLGLEYSHSEENIQITDHGSIALEKLNVTPHSGAIFSFWGSGGMFPVWMYCLSACATVEIGLAFRCFSVRKILIRVLCVRAPLSLRFA